MKLWGKLRGDFRVENWGCYVGWNPGLGEGLKMQAERRFESSGETQWLNPMANMAKLGSFFWCVKLAVKLFKGDSFCEKFHREFHEAKS